MNLNNLKAQKFITEVVKLQVQNKDLQVQLDERDKKIDGLKRAMLIHAGDICSANNETDGCRLDIEELTTTLIKKDKEIERLKKVIQHICCNSRLMSWMFSHTPHIRKMIKALQESEAE